MIFGFVVISAFFLFLGPANVTGVVGLGYLRYFTVQSNLLLGAVMVIVFVFDLLVLIGKRKTTPRFIKVLLLTFCSTVALVMTAVFYEGEGRLIRHGETLENAGIFMHLMTPMLTVIRVVGFEKEQQETKFYDSFFGAIPMIIYGIWYLTFISVTNGIGQAATDWYGSGRPTIEHRVATFFLLLFLTEVQGFAIWAGQRLVCEKFG